MKNNVKEHPASTEDTQNNHTDGRGLDVSACSASSFDFGAMNLSEDQRKLCESVDKMRTHGNKMDEHEKDSDEYRHHAEKMKEFGDVVSSIGATLGYS
jgi:hypothetical protein